MNKTILDFWQQAESMQPNLQNLREILDVFVHEPVFHCLHSLFGVKQPFDLDVAFEQVAIKKEGGSCRMMNLAAKKLLLKIGYNRVECIATDLVHVHQTHVASGTGVHMSMIVTLTEAEGKQRQYLFDPGNGNGPRVPIPLDGETVEDVLTSYRVVFDVNEKKYALEAYYKTWLTQFQFNINDVMERERLATYLHFVSQDTHFYRNNVYVLKCFPGGFMQIYNQTFRIRHSDGSIEEADVAKLGGLKRLLIEKFGMPKSFIDACDPQSDLVKSSAKALLEKLWQPLNTSPSIGKMIFNAGLEEEGAPAKTSDQRLLSFC